MLPDGFIIKNDTGDVVFHRLSRAKEHFAIIATIAFVRLDTDSIEAAFDRSGAFISGKDSFAFCHHRLCGFDQLISVHFRPLKCYRRGETVTSAATYSERAEAPRLL